jgi:UDP-N-acetylglucosamine/UDP-N-acetylgalactosamine 4-epimerase
MRSYTGVMNTLATGAAYRQVQAELARTRYRWLVTGVAGFVGSHLLETLLRYGQHVIGLDNLLTGHVRNLDEVRQAVAKADWARFQFVEGDIRCASTCAQLCQGVDYVLHEAALGSVSRSVHDPVLTSDINMLGFLNVIVAARDAKVRRLVYAASSAAYGNVADLPKVEERIGRPLSPYAVSKYTNELYADVFARSYGMASIGLRYFNVFGRRQDPAGEYAAVIPQWFAAMLAGERPRIFGDGDSSRDFCYVDNVVQANLLACFATDAAAVNQVYNVAVGARTSLNSLFRIMRSLLAAREPALAAIEAHYGQFRPGDIRHSQADIAKARRLLGYVPTHGLEDGLRESLDWYVVRLQAMN